MGEIVQPTAMHDEILEAFHLLGQSETGLLSSRVSATGRAMGFTYMRPGGLVESINLMLTPSFITEAQARYLNKVSLAVKRGIDALYANWFADKSLQRILAFNPDEEGWIRGLYRKKSGPFPEPLWYRLDGHFHMQRDDWADRISIFEINACAVGGIHYSPVADDLFMQVVLPVIKARIPGFPMVLENPDLRAMLKSLIIDHAALIGRRSLNVAFAEDTTLTEGITEGPYIVEYLNGAGVNAVYCDPRELYVKDAEVFYKDLQIDIVYRNFELSDMIEMEKEGDDLSAMRLAFGRNMVISSLCGDFDHKSMWEALGSGEFDRYFTRADADLLKKHLLWTRVAGQRKTEGPEGFEIDLMEYAFGNKDILVLKPNRQCGGYGVTIGREVSAPEWSALLDTAVREEGDWVVQRFGAPEERVFPLFEDGALVFERHNIVYGLTSVPGATGVLGRVSREGVVNVARQGGLMPVLRVP